jgi:hypothetical protein
MGAISSLNVKLGVNDFQDFATKPSAPLVDGKIPVISLFICTKPIKESISTSPFIF